MYFFDNGKDAFDYLIDHVILKAQKSIEIQMFIWRDDLIGRKIADAILNAANRGVQVNINKDLLGAIFEIAEENRKSLFHNHLTFDIKLKGFLMDKFYPMKGKNKFWYLGNNEYINKFESHNNISLNKDKVLNNHSKYLIADDEILVISGMNFEQKEYTHDLLKRKYYDFMIIEKSKDVVSQFKEKIDNIEMNLEQSSKSINFFSNQINDFNIRKGFFNCITQAKKQIDIVMAYWDDNEIVDLIIKQCKSGIVLNIYVPQNANIQKDLSLKVLEKIYEATKGDANIFFCHEMIHGKLIMIDKNYINFGSANLNNAGLNSMLETNIGFFSKDHRLDDSIIKAIAKIRGDSILMSSNSFRYNRLKALIERFVS